MSALVQSSPPSPFALPDPLGEDFTLGVEEEYFLVDAETRALRDDAEAVLDRARAPEGTVLGSELKRSQVESGSAVCRDLSEVRRSIVGLRQALAEAATQVGARLLASGTHPFARWDDDGGVTPHAAYLQLHETYGLLTTEQAVSGCHVHVGVRDPELAIAVMNRVRGWIPLLVAMTANSPFWMGHDSRYASFRTEVFHRWPTAGIPEHFEDRAAYDRLVEQLHATGSIDAPARLYWDVRPSARYPTLEFRAADVLMTVDECVAHAAICRALVETAHRQALAEEPLVAPRPELLRAALWRAARFGLSDDLIDVEAMQARPAAGVVASLLEHLRPVLEERGEWEEVNRIVGFLLREGTGALRQCRAQTEEEGLAAVVDRVCVATTAATA
ncbi:MAG TPA: glutamate--cysteine ligase [Aquihabitans sp.]|jgi:carboxylate-amine ligase|nr:glutamate--cysteine ligase [Aquihabitans sp.]